MTQISLRKELIYDISADIKRTVGVLVAICISVIGITIFQDFLEASRNGHAFYFSESILFKTIWILFIPLLGLLKIVLKNHSLDSYGKTSLFIVIPIIIHLALLPFVVFFFSILFFGGRYDLYDVLTYTLANDLYKLILIYSAFVLAYRYFSHKVTAADSFDRKVCIRKIIIGNGKYNTVVEVDDIYQITAATPYISIQLAVKNHLHTETLKSISGQLDNNKFVRIHKCTIVNLDKVISFTSRLNGDYEIMLNNKTAIRLSRTYVADFKSKFKVNHQVTS